MGGNVCGASLMLELRSVVAPVTRGLDRRRDGATRDKAELPGEDGVGDPWWLDSCSDSQPHLCPAPAAHRESTCRPVSNQGQYCDAPRRDGTPREVRTIEAVSSAVSPGPPSRLGLIRLATLGSNTPPSFDCKSGQWFGLIPRTVP